MWPLCVGTSITPLSVPRGLGRVVTTGQNDIWTWENCPLLHFKPGFGVFINTYRKSGIFLVSQCSRIFLKWSSGIFYFACMIFSITNILVYVFRLFFILAKKLDSWKCEIKSVTNIPKIPSPHFLLHHMCIF